MELLRLELLLPGFALVLARVTGIVLGAPMFSSSQIPAQFKVALTFALSLLAFPVVAGTLPARLTLGQAAVGCVGELVIGELIGLGVGAVFFAAQLAGSVVSHQAGLTLGEVFNPIFDSETTTLDQLWFFTVLMFFLGLGGHLAFIKIVLNSFHQVPPMAMCVDDDVAGSVTGLLQALFESAMRLAGPAILSLLLALLALGVLSKTMPQFNLMNVGFSFKIALALGVVGLTMATSDHVVTAALWDGLDRVGDLLNHLSERAVHAGG